MRKLRWVMDGGGFWDLDLSTPKSLDGVAVPVPGDTLPLGLSRGTRLSRPGQVDFMQRFMNSPLVPTFAKPHGLSLQRVLTLPLHDNWFVFFLGQFNLQRFISSIRSSEQTPGQVSSWLKTFETQLRQKSLYALGITSEFQLTSDDTLHLGLDYTNKPRGKAVFHHKFPHHDLTMQAEYPGIFVDKTGNYWDVPFSMAIDLASVTTNDSSASYHLSAHYNSGSPEPFDNIQDRSGGVPSTLLPGLAFKSAFSYKKNIDIWRSEAPKLKLVQPHDAFISNPHVSSSGIIGAAATTSFGDYVTKEHVDDRQGSRRFFLQASGINSSFLADIFASVSLTAQLGNFQKRSLDLTRFQAQLDFPSGSKFLSGATSLAQDLLNSQKPSLEAVQAICPNGTISFQQQIFGPVSFRVDSGIAIDLKDPNQIIHARETVFAIEYALQVLGSSKAVAWYCPQRQEFMTELRFYEK